MDNVYRELAQILDRLPNGFPPTQSGVELKILAKLFSPEQAGLACHLSLEPQTAAAISGRTGRDERATFAMLKSMVQKGLIEIERGQGGLAFKLMPFVVGFYERQNAQIDQEFAQLFEDYYHEALYKMLTMKPSVHRIIPVQTAIPINIAVMPYEQASVYLEGALSWGVLNCICRVQKKLIGQGCNHTIENCLAFSSRANAFDRTDVIRAISKEEALDVLASADKEGLVHSTGNFREGVTYICNCCTCACGLLRGIAEYGNFNSVAGSDFYAAVDGALCNGCGICLGRCLFKALDIEDGVCRIDTNRCLGCGLCVSACPSEALHLEQKPVAERTPPPQNEEEWRLIRSQAKARP